MHLANFVVLHPKAQLDRYPLILGRPCLATVYDFIGCRSSNMTIFDDDISKKIVLYPPGQPYSDLEQHI